MVATLTQPVVRRRYFLSLAILAATLPLQWMTLSATKAGTLRPSHLASMLFVACLGGAGLRARWRLQLGDIGRLFGTYSVAITVLAILHGNGPFNYLQQAAYAIVGLLVAVLVAGETQRGHVPRIAWWIGPIGLASFLWFFASAMRAAGIDPFATFARALRAGDPGIVNFALFRATFAGSTETASGNMRHEIFGGLLALTWVSLWAMSVRRPPTLVRWVITVCSWATFVFCVLSLSRAVLLAVVLAAAIPAARLLLTGALRSRFGLLAAVVGLVALIPIWSLLSSSLVTQTESYNQRGTATVQAIDDIIASPIIGRHIDQQTSHNFIIDTAAGAGIIVGGVAAVMFWILAKRWLRLFRRYIATGSRLDQIGLASATLPFVRAVTGGGGVLQLASFVGLGVFLGLSSGSAAPRQGLILESTKIPNLAIERAIQP